MMTRFGFVKFAPLFVNLVLSAIQKDLSGSQFKTIITPSQKSIKVHYDHVAKEIDAHKSAPQAALIKRLNPIIRGWANYFATVISCFTSKLHVLISETLAARGSIWKFE
jgi:hypothetical protein